jgi:hypothetical protein
MSVPEAPIAGDVRAVITWAPDDVRFGDSAGRYHCCFGVSSQKKAGSALFSDPVREDSARTHSEGADI